MLRIAVCDDEKYYRERIKELLEQYLADHKIEYTSDLFFSGEEFLNRPENAVKYDLVFMDINMERVDGIETAMRIRSFHSETAIVFVTAFINYAPEGYKVNAVRYIMKDMLEAALPECMDAVLERKRTVSVEFACVEGNVRLYTDNILYAESCRHKSIFHYLAEEAVIYQIYRKLDEIEGQLAESGFLRIHKSYLVNMRHIKKISNYETLMDNGERLPVPRLKFQKVKEAFVAYKGAL